MLWSSACELCGNSTRNSVSLCAACEKDLPFLLDVCKHCGIELQGPDGKTVCGQCLQKLPYVDYTISLFHYETPVDYMISELKYRQALSYASILGSLLLKKINNQKVTGSYPDVLLPVPLHLKRLKKRGFNQSLEIAKVLSKGLNIPINTSLVKRVINTQAQMDLNAQQRRKNIQGCFKIETKANKSDQLVEHIVIVDDVVTTASTVNELAKLLKDHGVKTVGVWSVARAILR